MTQTSPPAGQTRPASSRRLTVLLIVGLAILVSLGLAATVFIGLSLRGTALNESQDVAAGTRVLVDVRNARINVLPSPDERVHVVAEGTYLGRKPAVTARTTGGVTTISGGACQHRWFGRCELELTVTLPESLRLTVEGRNGAISASGLTGRLSLATTNGRIDVDGASGRLDLSSTNGAIRLREATSARASVRTTNGSVDLDFSEAPTTVEATSSNGAVTVRVPAGRSSYFVDVRTTNGAIDTSSVPSDRTATRTITVRTTNGGVTVAAN